MSGSLASYIALGSTGCTIGGDAFTSFQTLAGQTGATELAASAITINPSGGTVDPTLTFATTQSAAAPTLLESIFTYDLSGPSFTSSSTTLSNSSETVDGAVTEVENFCAGGTFGADGVDGCTGTAGSLVALDGVQNQDQSSLGPVTSLQVTNDFTVDGGTGGTASGGTFTNDFTATTATPEPSTFALGVLGLLFVRKALWRNR